MKKFFMIIVALTILGVGELVAQQAEKQEGGPYNKGPVGQPWYDFKDYFPGVESSLKFNNKFYTDQQFELFLRTYLGDKYSEVRDNEFKRRPFITEQQNILKERIQTYDLVNGLYYVHAYVEVGEYDFDKKGFWCGWRSPQDEFFIFANGGLLIRSSNVTSSYWGDMPSLIVVPKVFPNRYFFAMEPEDAERLVEYFKTQDSRLLRLLLYFKFDPDFAKTKKFTDIAKNQDRSFVFPVQMFSMIIKKTDSMGEGPLAEIKSVNIVETR
jgi:hypothetical protein